jgi:hypothetical protein
MTFVVDFIMVGDKFSKGREEFERVIKLHKYATVVNKEPYQVCLFY